MNIMLKVQSFSISDSIGINKLLERYRLASGAHILVSNGKLCVPYEDGLEILEGPEEEPEGS